MINISKIACIRVSMNMIIMQDVSMIMVRNLRRRRRVGSRERIEKIMELLSIVFLLVSAVCIWKFTVLILWRKMCIGEKLSHSLPLLLFLWRSGAIFKLSAPKIHLLSLKISQKSMTTWKPNKTIYLVHASTVNIQNLGVSLIAVHAATA